jgi:hypothetical protein
MSLKRVLSTARGIDKQFQRWRAPDRRRLLVNARTAMNFATTAPIVERLQLDERVEVYFTSSEDPELVEAIFAAAVQPFEFVTPRQASLMQFDVYLAADFLWLKLPRGARRVQTFHGVAGKFTIRRRSRCGVGTGCSLSINDGCDILSRVARLMRVVRRRG